MKKKEDEINENEEAKLSWEEFRYRHEHYWKSVYKLGFILFLLLFYPYIEDKYSLPIPELFKKLAILLPIFASCIFSWFLWEEHTRVDAANSRYKAKSYAKGTATVNSRISLGKLSTLVFFIFFFILSILVFLDNFNVSEL